ncbi:MAG TPA: FxsA family protein [Euzebyales bacterium]|nr:FxsA family protein [Euzebyales bacterium]
MRALLVLIFVVVPLIELAIILQVGELVGLWWTVAALLLVSIVGAWLVRREGTRAWRRFREALAGGRVPADEVLEGALVLFGGALLLTPGFATDTLGLLLMIPPTRALVARTFKRRLGERFSVTTLGPSGGAAPRRRRDVVDVEVINVEREQVARNGDVNSRGPG